MILLQMTPDPTSVDWSNAESVMVFIVLCLFFVIWWIAADRKRVIDHLKEEQTWSREIGAKSVEYITKVESEMETVNNIEKIAHETLQLSKEIKTEVTRHGAN